MFAWLSARPGVLPEVTSVTVRAVGGLAELDIPDPVRPKRKKPTDSAQLVPAPPPAPVPEPVVSDGGLRGVLPLFMRLRTEQANRGTDGAWMTCTFDFAADGRYRTRCDYQRRPVWRKTPLAAVERVMYSEDLRFHPRTDDHVPDWMRSAVTRTTEDVLIDAAIASGTGTPAFTEVTQSSVLTPMVDARWLALVAREIGIVPDPNDVSTFVDVLLPVLADSRPDSLTVTRDELTAYGTQLVYGALVGAQTGQFGVPGIPEPDRVAAELSLLSTVHELNT